MLAIGVAAGAASFTHVHDLAAAHRQGGWLAWADAIVLELMSIASGLEIRRRRRNHQHLATPTTVLVCAVLLSLAAQVIQAEPTPIGWIAAAVPAAGFLTMVKIALGYHPSPGNPPRSATADRQRPMAGIDESPERNQPSRNARTPQDRAGDTDVHRLLPAARDAADQITATGRTVTRETLADTLRANGFAVSTARASTLIKLLKTAPTSQPGVITAATSTGEPTP